MAKNYIAPEQGYDAVFLPASLREGRESLHGCEDEIYVIYCYYLDTINKRSFEIEILDRATVLELCTFSADDYKIFFECLPDYFNGRWYYADEGTANFNELYLLYSDADFVTSRDGTKKDEYEFIRNWAFNS